MGCWNETDGITQLPILYGDDVRVFVLRGGGSKRREGGGTCNINDIWSPIGPPIRGTYNDYGGVQNIVEDKSAEILFDAIKNNWPKEKINGRGDKIIPLDKMTLSEALYYIERDYVKVNDYAGEPEKLGIMFMLEEVYQAMIQYNPITLDFYTKSDLYRPIRESFESSITDYYVETFKFYRKIDKLKNQDGKKDFSLFMTSMSAIIFNDISDGATGSFRDAIIKACRDQINPSSSAAEELIALTVDWFSLTKAMMEARKMWTPQTGKGGQHEGRNIYRLINKVSSQILDAREKVREEESEDEETPDENGYFPYQLQHNTDVKKK